MVLEVAQSDDKEHLASTIISHVIVHLQTSTVILRHLTVVLREVAGPIGQAR